MRSDPIVFAHANEAASREPRFVVRIEFDVASPHITSHDDIPSVPGDVIEGALQKPSAISQKIIPDEGRSEIGSFTFQLVDVAGAFTDSMRSQLLDQSAGLRRRRVQFYVGYAGMDFTTFQLFQTQIVSRCSYNRGVYEVRCADITRELRKEVFRPVSTTLRDSISDTATTVPVYNTSTFFMVAHGAAYSDAPNVTVGYVRLENEIIRYTGQTLDSFTGCTRASLNTKAVSHAVDAATAQDRRTKVEEYVYLEGPGPQLAYAVTTGVLYGTLNTLPPNWNLGVDTAYVRLTDFTAIGLDLWNPANDAASLILRFEGLTEQDGKRFLEKELYLLMGCYSPIYADGTIGLRRMVGLISDASPVVTLTERQIVSLSPLEHDYGSLHNDFRIEWAYDPLAEGYARTTGFFDAESILTHGEADLLTYEFRGLHSQRATDSTIAVRLDAIRDRYATPPQTITASVFGSLNRLEVGDVVRLKVPETILRDFAGAPGEYNRAFEIQQRTYDAVSGDVTLDLFGSTARPGSLPTTNTGTIPLPDAFYSSAGTALGTVITITSGTAATGSFTLTGTSDLNATGSIFYYLGDLTIPSGCNITLANNVQLRIMGFLTLNGTINGVGHGHAGVADPGTGTWDTVFQGIPGYIGNSRGWDGMRTLVSGKTPTRVSTIPAQLVIGLNSVVPLQTLAVAGTALQGLPSDIRGGGGAPGGRFIQNSTFIAAGGAGANGGAGFCLICRGLAMGAAATINLSGANPAAPAMVGSDSGFVGSGGAGAPGAFLLLLDGNTLSIPVITGKFIGTTGTITQPPTAMSERTGMYFNTTLGLHDDRFPLTDSGYADPAVISALDMSNAAIRIQYIPETLSANPDADDRPAAPTNLIATNGTGGNVLTWSLPDLDTFDVIEVWASIDNNRTNALKVGETRSSSFFHQLPLGGLYYYWTRSKVNPVSGRPPVYSEWERPGVNDGQSSNSSAPGQQPNTPQDFKATGKAGGIQFNWTLPWANMVGKIELWEHTSATPFSSAVKKWEGFGLGYFLVKADTTTRYYWLVLNRSGEASVPQPPVTGLAGAAASAATTLTAYANPSSLTRTAGISVNPATVTSLPTTITAVGNTGSPSYAWSLLIGGTGITINNPTSPTTTFTATHVLDGSSVYDVARCVVTDSLTSVNVDVGVTLYFPSIA